MLFYKKKNTHKGDGINHSENDYLIKMLDNQWMKKSEIYPSNYPQKFIPHKLKTWERKSTFLFIKYVKEGNLEPQ